MGKMQRDKGKQGEREVAQILREHGFTDAKRGVQYHGGPDSPDVTGIPGIHIEVKRTETLRLWDAVEQSHQDAGEGEIPVVVHRPSRKQWIAIIDFEDFLDIYRANND